MLLKEKESYSSSKLKPRKAQGTPPKKSTAVEKERQAPKFSVAEGVVADVDEDVDESEPGM